MSQQEPNANEHLEPMLRRWGMREAVRNTEVLPCRLPKAGEAARHSPSGAYLLRWIPPLAAAAMLLAAALLFSLGSVKDLIFGKSAARSAPAALPATAPADDGKVRKLEAQLALAREELKSAGAELASISAQLEDAGAKLAKAIDPEAHAAAIARREKELLEQFDQTKTTMEHAIRDEAEKQAQSLREKLDAKNVDLDKVQRDLGNADKRLEMAKNELLTMQRELTEARLRQSVATTELASQQKLHDETLAALKKSRAELAEMKGQFDAMMDNFQRIYLASIAAERQPLALRQKAARSANIIGRCTDLRRQYSHDGTGKLLESIEVAFTRLDMLDPADARAADMFAALVRKTDLQQRIDAALAETGTDPQIRALLCEAKLILTGVGNAT